MQTPLAKTESAPTLPAAALADEDDLNLPIAPPDMPLRPSSASLDALVTHAQALLPLVEHAGNSQAARLARKAGFKPFVI